MSKIIPGIFSSSGRFVETKNDGDIIDRNAVAFIEIYNNFTMDSTQKMMEEYKEILSSDFVLDEVGTGMVCNSHEEFFETMKAWRNGFTDCKGTIRRATRSGNMVFLETFFSGHHDGPFNVPGYESEATGRLVTCRGLFVMEFNKDGKMKKSTNYFDLFKMLKEVGALP